MEGTLTIEHILNYNISKFGRNLSKNNRDTASGKWSKVTETMSKIVKKIQNQTFSFKWQYDDVTRSLLTKSYMKSYLHLIGFQNMQSKLGVHGLFFEL